MSDINELTDLKDGCINLLENKEYDICHFNTNTNNLIVKGLTDTIFTGDVTKSITLNEKNIVFENITFRNFNGINLIDCDVIFRKCKFYNIYNTAITLTNSRAVIEGCECDSTGLNPNKIIQYQGCFVYSRNSILRINNNVIKNTRGQGAIIFIESTLNCSYNIISDTAYRAIELYKSGNKGVISFNTISRCGWINTDNTGVGCNGIFASAPVDVNIISNVIVDVYENGIEGGFNLVKDNYIENTGVAINTNPTPSTEGIWCNGKCYINNVVVNPHLEGFKFVNSNGTRSNLLLQNNTVIKGDNSITPSSISIYGEGLTDSTIKGNVSVGYDNFIFISERDATEGKANVIFSDNSSDKYIFKSGSHIANFVINENYCTLDFNLKVDNLLENNIKLLNCTNVIDTNEGIQLTAINSYGSSIYKDIESPFNSTIIRLTAQVKATGAFVLRVIPLKDGQPDYKSAITRNFDSNGNLIDCSLCCIMNSCFRVDIKGTNIKKDMFTIKKMSVMMSDNKIKY